MKRNALIVQKRTGTIFILLFIFAFIFASGTDENESRNIVDLNTAALGNGNVQLFWSPVPNATGYKIYRSDNPVPFESANWKPLARVANTSYVTTGDADKRFYCVTWDDIPASTVNFALVEGGTFNNGASNVTISTFYMSRGEVTQAEYLAVTGENPSSHPLNYGIGPNYPVWNVSWFDAIRYCNLRSIQESMTPCYSYATFGTNPANWPADWTSQVLNMSEGVFCNWNANGYRLPTEMEWQFAARGGIYSQDFTFSGSDNINLVGWYWGNWGTYWYSPHSICALSPNETGVYDMSGNLDEWVWDIPDSYPTSSQTNPHGPSYLHYQRIWRGGAWNISNPSYQCAVVYRGWGAANIAGSTLGFRVCRIAP